MNGYEEHPEYKGIYIKSNTNRVISSDNINVYFRLSSNEPWLVTRIWSPAYHEILYGKSKLKPTFAPPLDENKLVDYNLMSSSEYIEKYCKYENVNINGIYRQVPIYCVRSKL